MTAKHQPLRIKKPGQGHRHPQAEVLTAASVSDAQTVRLNVEIPKVKRQALKSKAAADGKTVHEIINQLIDDYLAR